MVTRFTLTKCLFVSLIPALVCGNMLADEQDPQQQIENNVQARRMPVMKYTMASPRACLIGPPIWSTNAYYMPSGDAENFPRAHGTLRVPLGTRVVFCLSREIEGVWYSRSYGLLGTSLVLQWCRNCIGPVCDCIDCPAEPDDTELCPCVTIGKDGARDVRKGPSIGRAKVGVPVRFRRPGFYHLRGIITTVAKPYYPRPLDAWYEHLLTPDDPNQVLPSIPVAVDRDIVYVRVRVVDILVDDVEPEEDPSQDPDIEHIRPIPKDIDPNEPIGLEADVNGDEVINFGDLAIIFQQWGREYAMPFTDDE